MNSAMPTKSQGSKSVIVTWQRSKSNCPLCVLHAVAEVSKAHGSSKGSSSWGADCFHRGHRSREDHPHQRALPGPLPAGGEGAWWVGGAWVMGVVFQHRLRHSGAALRSGT